ncbi:DUF3703 domain-containing protein [Flammeovirgaceae bacterium KN852]|uniref:DUF3703 domain-containing protein n=1 Tax=Marinigracilibium pacificum TaxID=2729599 RepID=A0A848J3Q6_9BACT|nr:DUF3703 domain-containing protein [Marinigracilibium pacificum]
MNIHTRMPKKLIPYFEKEITLYTALKAENKLQEAWTHLENAHVIGQAYPWQHTYAHWKMLEFGFYIKDTKEIIGQLPRLFVGGVKSFVRIIPTGNTGGANISPLKKLPIKKEIIDTFNSVRD